MPALRPLTLGQHQVWPPVVLAPMAGITNIGFRRLCREQGGGIYVCEMITTRALVERNPKTLRMIAFGDDEKPRSLQLYGTDPEITAAAVRIVVERNLADHIDLNFGCPVPKVTRRGGGAALPWRRRLFARLVRAAVAAASPAGVPVTVKMRKGIDDDHLTYVEAGLAAQEAGVAAVALHGRTASQRYSGTADWDAIATLKQALDVPVLGNGDIWEADDALRMVAHTGVDGVVIGRGCLGRPWLFADLEAAFNGRPERRLPTLGEVAVTMRRHAELLVDQFTAGARNPARGERDGCTDFRKHVAWYLKGFPVGGELRRSLAMIESLAQLDDLLGKLDPAEPFPVTALGQPRGRTNSPGKVFLPEGWLASRDDDTVPEGAEMDDSGG
ncbi:tRNA-dihydrouridine synthase [Micromonospora saelicesensis]|uniref:tRNA-dihydrouridine synthase n=1 Tax=Micromonospora saelicesensis TaxID=285676 RepID=A0A1C5AGL2_9ACTN|nr:tRNA-dihydrouridine synthase [Micromonospora saelicesensis]RAO45539.1 tRNA-dihydrouridine synthase [Micromonospora saelicesensis]RAO50823.1 tRNA-dihydrouridine synthase [Micromonospora saelicesensis]RAO52482.1 tRNA-dihydrouridine synthase [Micromonospora saelicesensis]SCF44355.1 putative TIM-barrel protein, nifR3 family [Micromonospora saelicesensis]